MDLDLTGFSGMADAEALAVSQGRTPVKNWGMAVSWVAARRARRIGLGTSAEVSISGSTVRIITGELVSEF